MIVKNFILAALLLTAIILTGCKEKKPPQEQYKPDARYADTVKKVDPNEVKIAHPVNDMSHPTENSNTRIPIPRPVRRMESAQAYSYNMGTHSASSGSDEKSTQKIYVYKRPSFIRRYHNAQPRPVTFKPHPRPSFASNYFRKPEHHKVSSQHGSFYRPKWRQKRDNKPKLNNFKKSKNKNTISKYKGK